MKKITKLFIVVLIVAVGSNVLAQKFGVRAGLNLSNMLAKDDDDKYSDDFKMKPGFHVGPIAEFNFNDMLSLETGLLFSTKGFKIKEDVTVLGTTAEVKGSYNLYYIDIPITAKGTFDVGGVKVYGALGPYIGIGLFGKSKYKTTIGGDSETNDEDINWGTGDDDSFKRFDAGLTIGGGVEINAMQIGLAYNLGLANIAAHTDGGYKTNNRVFQIFFAYKFGGE